LTRTPHPDSPHSADAADAEANGRALLSVAITEPVAPHLAPAAIQMPRMLRALRYPGFRYFWAANFLSNTGTWMQNIAQGWLVLELTNSAFWLGVVGFAASVPMLGFSLLGGVIADRVDRRRMMVRTQTAMMLFAFLLAALTWLKIINVPLIVLLAFATGVAMSLNTPSYQALVPQLVPREVLANAIGLNSAQYNMSRVIGPTLGGFAMHWFGAGGNFFLNGLSFLTLLAVLLRMRMPAPELSDESATLWQRLSDGFRYVYDNRVMAALLSAVGLASILGVPYLMFIPLFARNILHVGERGFGLLMAFSGLGAFGAAITIAYFGKFRRSGKLVARAGSVFFVAVIAFTFSRSFALSAFLMALAGYSMILMVATVNTLLQHLAAEEMRGRVMSIYATAFLGFAPVGSLIAGSLAGAVTAPYAIAGMSALGLVGIWALYFTQPELRRLD
jgi:MFS family permease